jgi:hypothetical protein
VVVEPGWAFSGARSAMVMGCGFYSREHQQAERRARSYI